MEVSVKFIRFEATIRQMRLVSKISMPNLKLFDRPQIKFRRGISEI